MEDAQITKNVTGVSRILLYILILVCIVLALLQIRSCQKDKQNDDYELMLKQARDTTVMYKNKLGEEVYARMQVQGSLDNLIKVYSKNYLDSITRLFNAKLKDIAAYTMIASTKSSDIPLKDQKVVFVTPATDYTGTDTCPKVLYMSGTFVSKYDSSVVRLGDSAYNRIYSNDVLELLTTKKPVGNFFNRRWQTTFNIKGQNPDATYKINNNFTVNETKPARVVLVAYVGAGYNPFNFKDWGRPVGTFGLGIGYVLAKLK